MSELVVVRHAQASLFAENYDQLSDLGQMQASALGRYWREALDPSLLAERAYSGPARRHQHTAELAHAELERPPPVEVLEGFDEHDGLALTKRAVKDLSADEIITARVAAIAATGEDRPRRSAAYQALFAEVMGRWLDGAYGPDGVETWPDFEGRVLAALEQLVARAEGTRRVVLFTSVGPTAVLLRRAIGLDPHAAYALAYRQRNASVSRFLFSGRRFGLDAFNEVSHLRDPAHHTFR